MPKNLEVFKKDSEDMSKGHKSQLKIVSIGQIWDNVSNLNLARQDISCFKLNKGYIMTNLNKVCRLYNRYML